MLRRRAYLGAFGKAKKPKPASDPCTEAAALRKKMWQTSVFKKERREYEKQANEAARKCKPTKGDKGLFRPGYPPDVLWDLPVRKRKVDASGIFSPEDTIVAIARGMHPGIHRKAEDKAVAEAGLQTLRQAGLPLPKKRDADSVRRAVAKYGKNLKTAAWGMRGVLLLGGVGMAVSSAIHNMVPAIASLFGPIGAIVAAAASGHIQITKAIGKKVMTEQENYFIDGLNAFKKRGAPRGGSARDKISEPPETRHEDAPSRSVWGWVSAGVVIVLVTAVAVAHNNSERREAT